MGGRFDRRGAAYPGLAVAGLLLVAAALLFLVLYLALPAHDHFGALVAIGILALVFGLASYLARALSVDPAPARLACYGFLGMGFAVLLLTIGLNVGNQLSLIGQLAVLVVLVLLIAGVAAFAGWRSTRLGAESRRREHPAEGGPATPPHPVDYAAAKEPAPADPSPAPGGKP